MKIAIDFIILILLYIIIFYRIWIAKGKDVFLVNTLMYIYLSFVLYFTLMPITASLPFVFDHAYRPMNLDPFVDIISNHGDSIRQVELNTVMTIPFGFLLPLIGNRNINLVKVIVCTLMLSLGIELLQPLISSFRSADITDLITNTIGGIIGYIIYLVLKPLLIKFLEHIKKSGEGFKEQDHQT